MGELLQLHVPLPGIFNVKSSLHLMNDLKEIPLDQNLRLASFDVGNMYSNVPTGEKKFAFLNSCVPNKTLMIN